MVSREDRRAALFLVLLAAAGVVVRFGGGSITTPGAVLYRADRAADRPPHDSVAERAARLARPLGPGERIDLNTASAQELTRLPRIGPALAARIVANRIADGPFARIDELERVSGIGPAVMKSVRGHVRAGGNRPTIRLSGRPLTVMLNTATMEDLAQLPGIGRGRARAIVEDRRVRGPYRDVDDLLRVQGIGPVTINRIRGLVKP